MSKTFFQIHIAELVWLTFFSFSPPSLFYPFHKQNETSDYACVKGETFETSEKSWNFFPQSSTIFELWKNWVAVPYKTINQTVEFVEKSSTIDLVRRYIKKFHKISPYMNVANLWKLFPLSMLLHLSISFSQSTTQSIPGWKNTMCRNDRKSSSYLARSTF